MKLVNISKKDCSSLELLGMRKTINEVTPADYNIAQVNSEISEILTVQ